MGPFTNGVPVNRIIKESMTDLREYMTSGIIEKYVLGLALPEEISEIEALSNQHPEIEAAITEFCLLVEKNAFANSIEPPEIIKPELLATIDFMERLEHGEPMTFPPLLSEASRIDDYAEWLNRPGMTRSANAPNIELKIIGYTPTCSTAIVWVKDKTPEEVHTKEFESFFIVEGTCIIHIGSNKHALVPGDYLTIPLFEKHHVEVTSSQPCKVILQRLAA